MARLLLIEDNQANLELMRYLLSAFGHEVLTAEDGSAGLAAARSEHPQLVLCDIHLPKMDGYEVARQIKSDPELRRLPVIAITALAMVGDRERGLQAGFDAYIFKPIEPTTFVGEVERYLPAA